MFCGIGRNKDGDCKKPPKSPIVFGKQNNDKNPSVSPITTKLNLQKDLRYHQYKLVTKPLKKL